jgi:hypothetical protein
MPMTENIVQMAKLTVKAKVFIARTEYCLRVSKTCAPLWPATLGTAVTGMIGASFLSNTVFSVDKSGYSPAIL